jgi:hypothetical protein
MLLCEAIATGYAMSDDHCVVGLGFMLLLLPFQKRTLIINQGGYLLSTIRRERTTVEKDNQKRTLLICQGEFFLIPNQIRTLTINQKGNPIINQRFPLHHQSGWFLFINQKGALIIDHKRT